MNLLQFNKKIYILRSKLILKCQVLGKIGSCYYNMEIS